MWGINVFIMQIDYVKISCKEDVHICCTNFAKKWNEICKKELAGGKYMENDCFLRTLKFEMQFLSHDDAAHVSNKMRFAIFRRALAPTLCHHWCSSMQASQISGAFTGLYGPRHSSYLVNSTMASLNRTLRIAHNLRTTLFNARFVSSFSCISRTSFRYGFNNALA